MLDLFIYTFYQEVRDMGFLNSNFQKEGKGISKDTPEKTGFALFLERSRKW